MKHVEAVKKSIMENGLIEPGEHIGAAVSGGADSVFLLYALHALQRELKFSLTALHLEHGIRGKASQKDMSFVKRICRSLNIPLVTGQADTRALAREKGWSLEQAARVLRYRFFARTAEDAGMDKIALGHHFGDQAETILLNLSRGCGMQGLLGMQPFRPPYYIRPMLGLKKKEIVAALRAEKIAYRTDRTNKNIAYARNRIRHKVLPELIRINPKAEQNILRTAEALAAEDDYLAQTAATEYAERMDKADGAVRLSLKGWGMVHTAVKRRVIRRVLETHFSLADVEFIHIESIIGISLTQNGKRTDVPGGITAAKAYDALVFFQSKSTEYPPVPLVFGKNTVFEYAGYTFELDWHADAEFGEGAECLNADSLKRAILRTPRPDDYIQPLGMTGKKKLSDYMSDCKVPLHLRKDLPVLADGDAVLMVTGVGIGETAKVTEDTQQICRIRFGKI